MASDAPQDPTRSIQVGLENTRINYYDIMVIGNAGQGKSTTSDKIIIANPNHEKYTLEMPVGGQANQQGMTVDQNQQVKYTDISMWLAHGSEKSEFESHLKFLHYCRTKEKPHEEINRVRSALESGANEVFKPTTECEVLSNETTRVRIMDVPGFFDGASVLAKQQQEIPEGADPMSPLDMNNLDIMRKIIRIQTALSMKFNRILYFLPCRGPLERANAHLKLELKWMAHFFDRAIFKSMVLVATIPARFSKMPAMTDDEKFPQEDVKMTRNLFRQALKEVFNNPPPNNPLPDPPLIFISLTDTCEQILAKIKGATVEQEGLHLQIDPSTCAECGVKIGVVKGQRVTCYFGEDPANAIPYEESTCHPCFIPKYSRIDKIWGGFKYIVSFGWISDPWPVFVGEKCAACGGVANMHGCMKVGKEYGKGKQKITVDHTNQVVDGTVPDEQAEENSARHDTSQSQPGGHEQNGVNQSQAAPQDTESSMTIVEGGMANMRLHMEHPPNQPYMVERSADNPAFTGEGGT